MNKTNWKNKFVFGMVVATFACLVPRAEAQLIQNITSGTFNYYMGATGHTPVWTTTGQTQTLPSGSFNLVVSMNSNSVYWSDGGPTFVNGVLGPYGSDVSSYLGNAGNQFFVSTSMVYTGPAPLDAAAIPNYQLTYNITSISIYAATATGSPITLNWNEVQKNIHSQSPQALTGDANSWTDAADYQNVVWNPGSYGEGVADYNEGLSRYFNLTESIAESVVIDGFQITGFATLSYTAIPEPSTVGLLGLAGMGIFLLKRRSRSLA